MTGLEELVTKLVKSDLIVISTTILGTLIVKDLLSGLANGVLFIMNKNFNVGDKVVLDGEDATIINIGFRQTIFEVNGVWVYYYNDRIKYLKLGKRK